MILLIDNYDSFSYNLYQMLGVLKPDIRVVRNDEFDLAALTHFAPSHVVISPGPGRPEDAGICVELIRHCAGRLPLLGVCLGHQALCQAFGANIVHAPRLMHGKASEVELDSSSPLFEGLPARIKVARYHSLIAASDTIPKTLRVTAWTNEGEVMAVEYCAGHGYPAFGVQFHPESILTPEGAHILKNFLAPVPLSPAKHQGYERSTA
ncbi:MAG: aminodeoxychorismate/anthranilate synthase component II [Coriobacteriales bacterium]|jgi:anthranilate synthase component 2|nr:aminodeoxychorismate/anthranilate synthase component II [Coriobacteriales bacterium]